MTERFIAFQGVSGAYSHLACLEARPDLVPLPCPDFEACIRAVHEGNAVAAMLPVDNSIAGRVADMHHLLPKSGLRIVGEYFLPVRHCLLGIKGVTLADITTVSSHTHALPQCRDIIRRHGWQKHVGIDTAAAAQDVAQRNDPSWAAIASSLAGEIYGLDVLATDVADAKNNTTRFLIMVPEAAATVPDMSAGPVLTSLMFHVRSVPAALYKALGGFATNGLNLSKIESYQVDGDFDAAVFYCDVDGHPDTPAMQRAMEELRFFARSVDVLGVYPAQAVRHTRKYEN